MDLSPGEWLLLVLIALFLVADVLVMAGKA